MNWAIHCFVYSLHHAYEETPRLKEVNWADQGHMIVIEE